MKGVFDMRGGDDTARGNALEPAEVTNLLDTSAFAELHRETDRIFV